MANNFQRIARKAREVGEAQQAKAEVQRVRAEKAAKFTELAGDPDIADVVEDLIDRIMSDDIKAHDAATNSSGQVGTQTGLKDAIIGLRPELPIQFGATEILSLLESKNFGFAGKDPKGAVKDALYAMTKSGWPKPLIKLAKRGEGGQPNLYEFI
jgi:hypothetical protein